MPLKIFNNRLTRAISLTQQDIDQSELVQSLIAKRGEGR